MKPGTSVAHKPKKRWPKRVFYGIVALLAAAWYVPRISAGSYREKAHVALERALGRKVEIGRVQFRLLPTPGLTISDVVIGEDPNIGAEPAAYVTTLHAVPRLSSLLGGPLAFSSVDLEDASLNLTRVDRPQTGVRWNFDSLMRPEALATFPSIHMSDGRINFKFGDTKSVFYLLNTDVDLWPPDSADGPWTLRIHADPARTDRPQRGFGSFEMRGQWHPDNRSTTLDVRLEQSELGDMLTLFNGHESGIQGHISGDAHLAGPLNRIGIAGRMTVSDLHGWDQTPPGGSGWRFAIGGAIDVPGQTVDLDAKVAGAQAPLRVRYRVADYLRRPRWGVTVNVKGFPLAPVPDIARNLGFPVPADYRFDGTADGAVGYSIAGGAPRMDGLMGLSNTTLIVAGTPPLHVPFAQLHFSGSTIALDAAAVTNDNKDTAAISGSWDVAARQFNAEISSDAMSIASLRRQISVAGIPLLSSVTSGTWRGDLHYRNGPRQGNAPQQSGWSGDVSLENADIPFEAFSEPVHVISADGMIDGTALSLKHVSLAIGDLLAQGEYRYDPHSPRPHRFRLVVPEASGPAIEKLLMPALHRGNFFTYAFNFGRVPEPGWLRNMRADGTIQTGRLNLAGGQLSNLRARVIWEGTDVRFTGLETQFGDAAFTGLALAHLAGRQPIYQVSGSLTGLPWGTGAVNAEGTLSTSGTGAALLANMRAKGTFEGRDIEFTAPDVYDTVSGAFVFAVGARAPRLQLSQLTMRTGGVTYLGSADMDATGQLVLKLSDPAKHAQASGPALKPAQ